MINKICNLIDKIPQKYFCGSTKQYNILQIIKNYTVCETSVFVVLPNLYEAQKYYDSLVNIMGVDKCLFFPVDQTLTHLTALGSIDFKFERLFTFRKLLSNEKYIIVTTVDGALFKTLSPQDYRNAVLSLTQNEKYNFNEIIEFLSISGFKKMPIVSNLGEYSVRGSIIDFFGINNSFPVRLDFAFDTLEQIKQFNIETQRSISILSNIEISPINELFYSSKLLYEALDRIDIFIKNKNLSDKEKDVLENDIIKLKNRHDLNKLLIYTVFFNDHSYNIFSFVNESKIFLLDFEKALINEQTETQNVNEFKDLLGSVVLSIEYKFSLHELINIASYIERKNSFNLGISEIKSFNNNYNLLIKYLKEWQNNTHLLFITDAKIYESVENKLKENNFTYAKEIKKNHICLLQSKIDIPFYSIYDKLHIIGDSCFGFKADTLVNYRSVINNSSIVKDTDELQINDYVVHYDYGIGQYKGLETIELNGRIRDYLSIEYQDTQILRVPVEQIDLVLKYSSYDGITPRLSKIGGKHWSVTKFNTVKKIKEQSDLLLELYVKRKNSIGYSFLPDKESETEIAKSFEYVESNDQLKAIEDVYYDMEQNIPMDRLIVGDVGFGKTEIALRASYKAVMSGKQVCYLAPTTVLARQHFYTFKNRMDELGVNIALLNRFVSAKEVKRIFDELEYGLIDIAIGTHKLLNPQVKFYNLGLLVIDEEQRFGVLHKEKIKNLKINVDTLTLSATPIPRTLQMANLGIRDFSRINTPPLNRYPIQTYVTPRNKIVIKEAIERELSRGGQVFYLYNKTKYIENITYELKRNYQKQELIMSMGK